MPVVARTFVGRCWPWCWPVPTGSLVGAARRRHAAAAAAAAPRRAARLVPKAVESGGLTVEPGPERLSAMPMFDRSLSQASRVSRPLQRLLNACRTER